MLPRGERERVVFESHNCEVKQHFVLLGGARVVWIYFTFAQSFSFTNV